MQFHKQCDYLLKFQTNNRISKSILLQKWPKNASDTEDDAYETLVLAYNKELDIHVLASSITKSDVEEESSPPYPTYVMTNSEEEMTILKNTTPIVIP